MQWCLLTYKRKKKKNEKEGKKNLAQIRVLKPRHLRWKRCQGRMDVRGILLEFYSAIDWEGCNLLRRLRVAWEGGGYPAADLWGEPGTLSTSVGLCDVNFLWQAEMIANLLQAPAVNIRPFCSWAFLDTGIYYVHLDLCPGTFAFSIQSAYDPGPLSASLGNTWETAPFSTLATGILTKQTGWGHHRGDHIKNQKVWCFAPSQMCFLLQCWGVQFYDIKLDRQAWWHVAAKLWHKCASSLCRNQMSVHF